MSQLGGCQGGIITLMVCVKDTATRPSDTLVSRLPSVCTAASGLTLWICNARSHRHKAQRSQADTAHIWVLAASFDGGTETLLRCSAASTWTVYNPVHSILTSTSAGHCAFHAMLWLEILCSAPLCARMY